MTQAEQVIPSKVTLAEVRARVDAAAKKPHPRLYTGVIDAAFMKKATAADPALADYARCLRASADRLLGEPLPERKMTGRRLLFVSRATLDHIIALGVSWKLTGETKYADRAIAEARAVCRFSDWNPSHFLDVGEMSLAVALCLDWFSDALTPEAREELVKGLLEKGLRTSERDPGWWIRATNNWGQVCHGGLVAAALALMDREPELAARVIHRAVVNVPVSMAVYAPDGGYPEGPGYWHYGTIYSLVLIDSLESGLGTDFGLSGLAGFDKTGNYIQVMAGPAFDNFNYADGGQSRRASALVYWFARRFGSPVNPALGEALASRWRLRAEGKQDASQVKQDRFEMEFLYALRKNEVKKDGRLPPLDWQDRGHVPVAVHRAAWDDPNALFAGIKAGSPSGNHGHMDSGSFILDADGVRWAVDLGADDYNRIETRGLNLWDKRQDSDRWRVFRLATGSHNTLMIDGQQQRVDGHALITDFSSDPASPHTTVELTPNYRGQALRVVRTLSLPERKRAEIKDTLAGLKPGSVVRWGMVTKAAPSIAGGRLTLKQAGKTLEMSVAGLTNAVWKTFETATPPAEHDSPNPGTVMVGFEATAPDSGSLGWTVSFVPGR